MAIHHMMMNIIFFLLCVTLLQFFINPAVSLPLYTDSIYDFASISDKFRVTLLQFFINPAVSLLLYTDSRAPLPPKTPLVFCNYNGSSCCDSVDDSNIREQFEPMNFTNINASVAVPLKNWPAKWRSFIPDLVTAAKTSETICENCMAILKRQNDSTEDQRA
ncbi:hypothetical protein L2E82_46889 [Cichorium intybus]|uniref:Uncharacterized protein n=1 Tax=Cichorium intybus TaxID=13427 RepID=A0ACB8YUG9_CICIN|nr:hypothetical protein L2E82_46889 [Cichorium intybus]